MTRQNNVPHDLAQARGFLKIDKALVFGGAFHGLSATALQAYLALSAKCFEAPNEAMRRRGVEPRQCAVGYAWLAKVVPGRRSGQGASRSALIRVIRQLVRRGLVRVVRQSRGPSHPTSYHLRDADEWRAWRQAGGFAAAKRLAPNPRDTAERSLPRRRPNHEEATADHREPAGPQRLADLGVFQRIKDMLDGRRPWPKAAKPQNSDGIE